MGENLVKKILNTHIVSGKPDEGDSIRLSIDQTLFHDATGTMVALKFESLGL
jgi:aconitate hydratase